MKRVVPFLTLLALCASGCRSGRTASAGSAPSAAPAVAVRSEVSRLDSIVCAEACCEYTCYYAAGSRNPKALEHLRAILFESYLVDVDFDDCADASGADRLRHRLLDSLRSLEWLDGEPWTAVHALYLAWSEQQLEREYIVYRAERDPAYLYDCPRSDSLLVRSADILTRSGNRFVGKVRELLRADERAKFERDSVTFDRAYLAYTLSRIDALLTAPDSIRNARELLFQRVSNHLNDGIHRRLGQDGTVDFSIYIPEFLQLFDSVKVESWEP
ncbi:hypothetical protein [Alistipes sp.]|uniref:hypothetical protein n=1 Tax=Alistipes sp. TaxID=1872444 RepID=UPI003AF1BEE0